MRASRRLIPIALMGMLAVAYVLARPFLPIPHLAILEFPVGALIVGVLLWLALRRGRPTPPPVWRRHEQVVRALPDPALAPHLAALEAWLETGASPDAAADVLAHARTNDPDDRSRLRERFLTEMQVAASRRSRETFLKEQITQGA